MANPGELLLSPTAPLESGRYPGHGYREEMHETFVAYRDVAVTLRDGTTIYIDLYRPHGTEPAAALIGWSPYGKHGLKNLDMMPGSDVDRSWISKHTIWEGADPEFWCPRGYAVVSPDPRGAWWSEGTLTFYTKERQDGYDLIEWLAAQPWSNGKVGMLGVSYLAIAQWLIAAERPPSLAAISPWEGLTDMYRDVFYTGGIPEKRFLHWWAKHSRFSLNEAEDIRTMAEQHPLLDEYWQDKLIDLPQIDVPAYIVAGWGDHGLHTRGTLDAFARISSEHKWLEVHGQKKWRYFYQPESVARQLAFFDHFLMGRPSDVLSWPRVRYELRESNAAATIETARDWPLPNTTTMRLDLVAAGGRLAEAAPADQADVSYTADRPDDQVRFRYVFEEDMEITGGAALRVWISADTHDQIDAFIMLRKIGVDGERVGFRWWAMFDEGPIALGWLRGTHRALSPDSTERQPIHDHVELLPIAPGEPVALDIEIWPSATLFRAGEGLELTIGANDLTIFTEDGVEPEHAPDNRGTYRVHTGPGFDSHLLLPRIVPKG